ncbi:type VI secretion system tube protein Hcp [Ottowia caeni]|uniref:type VI secretion system tube protein Hcp n=1 Tax=Ottowia caeni TaxID=2870339 RepID=UPI001E3AC82D|nr:type VI secretion system tube protein Hcp [Ottowia caeni]
MSDSFNYLNIDSVLERLRSLSHDESSGFHMVLELTGDAQGPIKAEDGTPQLPVVGFEWGLSSASSTTPEKATGRRQYRPLFITRRCDAATASIMSGLSRNEGMKATLSVFESNTDKQAVWKLELKKARLIQHITHTGGPVGGAQEILALAGLEFSLETAPQTSSGIRGGVRTFTDVLESV